jgi:hypothetical protein
VSSSPNTLIEANRHSRNDKMAASPLDAERKQASFDIRELTYILDGGEEATKRKELIRREVETDPILAKSLESYFRDRISEHKHALKVNQRLIQRVIELGLVDQNERMTFVETINEHLPISGSYFIITKWKIIAKFLGAPGNFLF